MLMQAGGHVRTGISPNAGRDISECGQRYLRMRAGISSGTGGDITVRTSSLSVYIRLWAMVMRRSTNIAMPMNSRKP